MKVLPCVLLTFVLLALQANNGLAGDENCDCMCAAGCRTEARWVQVGPGEKRCFCDCHCPPLSPGQQNPTPLPPSEPQDPTPNPPDDNYPGTPQPPAFSRPRQTPHHHENSWEICSSASSIYASYGCGGKILAAYAFPDYDLGKECCVAFKQMKQYCVFYQFATNFLSLILPLDLSQHCKRR